MPRYKILIEYEGSRYNGWQIQPEGKTIQGELESALGQILRQPTAVAGQGRTDSGVHAEAQVAHFDSPEPLDDYKLLHALKGVLPRDIAVWEMEEVADDFHARFDAKSRQYRYQVVTRPSPLLDAFAQYVWEDLDLGVMEECAWMILGEHDFECFTYSSDEQPSAVCTVDLSEWSQEGHLVTYRIRANRFVRHMVRRLVGTMLQVGQGKMSTEEFRDLLENPSKDRSGQGVRAKGLILERVEY